MTSQDEFEKQIKRDFLVEAGELLEEVEAEFLKLESNPDDGSVIDQIFRLAHTVKGSGFAAGFNDLASFAHVFENVLGNIRSGDLSVTESVVDTLLKSNDALIKYVSLLSQDMNADMDTSGLTEELKGYLEGHDVDAQLKETTTTSVDTLAGFGIFEDDPEEPHKLSVVKPLEEQLQPNLDVIKQSDGAILIVDDEDAIVDILESYLGGFDRRILTASDGQIALEQVTNNTVDLILCDLKMPNMTGIQLMCELRNRGVEIPVVVISGAAGREDLVKVLELGARDYIEKPFEAERVNVAVKNALNAKRTRDVVIELASLNFKAYVHSLKIADLHPENDRDETAKLRKSLEEIMDQIAALTNYLLSYTRSKQAA